VSEALASMKQWLEEVDAHRTERAERLERGSGPCRGYHDDPQEKEEVHCEECYEPGQPDDTVGDICDVDGCTHALTYRYGPESPHHDWDGGECWRCGGYYPPYYEGEGGIAIANQMEPEARIPESVVRDIVNQLEAAR
jgi:hypothetical protein